MPVDIIAHTVKIFRLIDGERDLRIVGALDNERAAFLVVPDGDGRNGPNPNFVTDSGDLSFIVGVGNFAKDRSVIDLVFRVFSTVVPGSLSWAPYGFP